jgi:hypothetical protein
MIAGRAWATMEEECREIFQSVEEALAEEQRQEVRGALCTPPDGARIAACLHLQRAAMRSLLLQRERATWRPPQRRPALRAWVN